ncbi:MAG TPA: ATP-binding protein [Acetobacteraceae bacterium]
MPDGREGQLRVAASGPIDTAGAQGLGAQGLIAILAPRGRDAPVIQQLLEQLGLSATICADLCGLLAAMLGGSEAVVVTEEALDGEGLEALLGWMDSQPPWSDFPFVVLATKQAGPRPSARSAILARLGAAVLLERPLNGETLASAAMAALRARSRQHQVREHLAARETAAEALRNLNATLEERIEQRTRALRSANTALRDSEAQFRAYFDNFPECLFVVNVHDDGSFRFEAYNPTAERSFGLRSQDIRGLTAETFMPKAVAADATAAFRACLARGETYRVAHELMLGDSIASFDTVLTPLRDQHGRIVRLLGAARDVTERNRLEERLRQAQKLEAIGQLTGGIAHDFNNLLQVVTGGLALLERARDDPKRHAELMEAIRRAADRGGELTKRLLTIARRQSLRPEAVDLAKWLDEGARDLLARGLRGDVTVETVVAPGLPPVEADPAELELAVLNLAVNARDAMPHGGTLRLTANEVKLDIADDMDGLRGRFVHLCVADTGHGMTPEVQARVFEPFFTTKGVGEGTGLGLPQVYGFARQSGGAVRLASEPGKGTTVSLFLPCSASPVHRETETTEASQRPMARAGAILVVEDDDDVAALVVDMLIQLGYTPTRVTNAAAALGALADGRRIDLIFTDIMMPGGMNGVALADEVARRRPGLPVLLTTGYSGGTGMPPNPHLALLRKPYRMEELAEALTAALERNSTPA